MTDIFRRQSTLIKLCRSLVIAIPAELVHLWNLRKGDKLVSYQIDNVLVVVPLAYLGILGEHPLIKHLEAYKPPPVL